MRDESNEIIKVNQFATRSDFEDWIVVDDNLLREKTKDAGENARKREIHFFHRGDDDMLQRMLNCVQPGSYIRPHRHSNPPKDELIYVLQGAIGFVVFDDTGKTGEDQFVLLDPGRGFYGADWRAGVWHTFFALEPNTVVIEVKSGPFKATNDKDFAPWAPLESDSNAETWFKNLEDKFRQYWKLPIRNWGVAK